MSLFAPSLYIAVFARDSKLSNSASRYWGGFLQQREAFIYFGGRVAAGLGALALIPVLSRGLGAEGYGRFGFAMVLALLVARLGSGWLQQAVPEFERSTALHAATGRLSLVSGVLVFVALFALAWLLGYGWFMALTMGLFALSWSWFASWDAFWRSQPGSGRVSVAEMVRFFLPLAVVLLWLVLPFRFTVPVALLAVAAGLAVAGWLLAGGRPAFAAKSEPGLYRALFVFGAPLGIWLGLATLQVLIGRAALDLTGQAAVLGLYSALQDLSLTVVVLLLLPFVLVLRERVQQVWSDENPLPSAPIYLRSVFLGFLSVLGLLAGAWVLGDVVISLLFVQNTGALVPPNIPLRMVFMLFVFGEGLAVLVLLTHRVYELSMRRARMLVLLLLTIFVQVLLLLFFYIFPGGINLVSVVIALMVSRLLYVLFTVNGTLKVYKKALVARLEAEAG